MPVLFHENVSLSDILNFFLNLMHKECTMYVHNIVIWIQKFEYLSKFALLRRYRVIGYCYFMRGSRKSFGGGGEGVGVRVIIVFSRGRESEFLLNMNLLYLISSKGFGVGWEGGWGWGVRTPGRPLDRSCRLP